MKQEAEITINGETRRVEVTEELRKIFEFGYLKIWKPKDGETYQYVADNGYIYEETWIGDGEDIFRWETSNCKQTEVECDFKLKKAKVETELRNFAKEHNEPIDWGNANQLKWYINWDYDINEIHLFFTTAFKGNDVYFSSQEIAEKAIKAVGEDRVKKYHLEVIE